jgi:hypothetical protein
VNIIVEVKCYEQSLTNYKLACLRVLEEKRRRRNKLKRQNNLYIKRKM